MLKLLWLFVAQPQFVDCGCLCVDGVGKTLCQSVAEAQQQPNMCPQDLVCPVPTEELRKESGSPLYYDSPAEHAHSCREVRIWDDKAAAYTGVKVCDVFTG